MRITKNKNILFIIIGILLIIMFRGNTYAAEGDFSLSKNVMSVKLNSTGYLTYIAGNGTVTWESSDPSVATVDNGTVRGLKVGKTIITATSGDESDTCEVSVEYANIIIGGNEGLSISSVNLIINEHDTENLTATVEDGAYNEVTDAIVNWRSSDTNVVTVDSTGTIRAVNPGTATITATTTGVSDTCEVKVYQAPKPTNFVNAQYDITFDGSNETLKISNIIPDDENSTYYYTITANNSKPNIITTENGSIDFTKMANVVETFIINTNDNYIYTRNLSKYTELNQDLYLWIIQEKKLPDYYYNATGNHIRYSTKLLVEGKKLDRIELQPLNLILQTFDIGYWNNTTTNEKENYTYIDFNFPSNTENRKFKLKIGKISDSAILSKIKNNDYSGIVELLSYAKSNDAVYSQDLTTTSTAYFRSDNALFDGNNLLENKAYYYIYAEFDDEEGKYYPIEGVTLGQAWLSSENDSWDLLAYTSSDFQWDNFNPSTENQTENKDNTTAPTEIPQTGATGFILIVATALIVISIVSFRKFRYLKDIK